MTELRGLIEHTPTVPEPAPSRIQCLTAWAAQCDDDASSRIMFQTAVIGTFFCFAVVNLTNLIIVVDLIVHHY